jgi:hypothetical protein
MDTRKLTDVLRATIDPAQRQQAEEQLSQVRAGHVAVMTFAMKHHWDDTQENSYAHKVFIADYSLCYFMSKSDGVYCQ